MGLDGEVLRISILAAKDRKNTIANASNIKSINAPRIMSDKITVVTHRKELTISSFG